MPIEIRELVIKATVHKQVQSKDTAYVTQQELRRFKKEVLDVVKHHLKEGKQDANGRF